jgi:hypothetical protein
MFGVKPGQLSGDLAPCHPLLSALCVERGMNGRRIEAQDLRRSHLRNASPSAGV